MQHSGNWEQLNLPSAQLWLIRVLFSISTAFLRRLVQKTYAAEGAQKKRSSARKRKEKKKRKNTFEQDDWLQDKYIHVYL